MFIKMLVYIRHEIDMGRGNGGMIYDTLLSTGRYRYKSTVIGAVCFGFTMIHYYTI